MAGSDKLSLISNVAASYLRRNSVSIDQIATVISTVTHAIEQSAKELSGSLTSEEQSPPPTETSPDRPLPAVPIKKSIQREYIVCLEDGIHARTLKRHLGTAHGMTPEQYRTK